MVHPIFTQAETRELLEERGFSVQYFKRGGLRLVHKHTGEGRFLNNETEAFLMIEGFAWGYRVGGHDGWLAARDSFSPAPGSVHPPGDDELDLLATLDDDSDIIQIDDDDDMEGFQNRLRSNGPQERRTIRIEHDVKRMN